MGYIRSLYNDAKKKVNAEEQEKNEQIIKSIITDAIQELKELENLNKESESEKKEEEREEEEEGEEREEEEEGEGEEEKKLTPMEIIIYNVISRVHTELCFPKKKKGGKRSRKSRKTKTAKKSRRTRRRRRN